MKVETINELREQTPQPPRDRRQGLIIVNTGNGKGKTSASLGVAFRALGWNWKVRIIQFIKGKWITGEKRICDCLPMDIELHAMGDGFTWDTQNPEQDIKTSESIWSFAKESIEKAEHDLIILDEINYIFSYNYLSIDSVISTLKNKPSWMHVICTGRDAPKELIEVADLVSEIQDVKHPFQSGIKAQRGIEF
jgi:cob(I)alamin adenosyltransferase